MSNPFRNAPVGPSDPPPRIVQIVPDDDVDLETAVRTLNVATSGFVTVTTTGGTTGPVYIAAGIWFGLPVKRVWEAGTTATSIVGGW